MADEQPFDFAAHIDRLLRDEIDKLAREHGLTREQVLDRAAAGMRAINMNPNR